MRELTHDLAAAYHHLTTGTPHTFPPIEIQYTDFAAWQQDQMAQVTGGTAYALSLMWCYVLDLTRRKRLCQTAQSWLNQGCLVIILTATDTTRLLRGNLPALNRGGGASNMRMSTSGLSHASLARGLVLTAKYLDRSLGCMSIGC